MTWFWLVMLPELRQFPADEQAHAMQIARATVLDLVELCGMAAGLVLVTVVTQYALSDLSLASRLAAAVLNFAVAAPLLIVALGPFHVRRLRRGLRDELQRRHQE